MSQHIGLQVEPADDEHHAYWPVSHFCHVQIHRSNWCKKIVRKYHLEVSYVRYEAFGSGGRKQLSKGAGRRSLGLGRCGQGETQVRRGKDRTWRAARSWNRPAREADRARCRRHR